MTGPQSYCAFGVGADRGTVPQSDDPGVLGRLRPALIDAAIVAWWFATLGLVGAIVWELVTPLAAFTRTADNGTMDEQELARQFGATGWFFVIAAVGGLVSGVLLLLWRSRGPVLMVLLVALGGALATLVMVQVGLALGPADPQQVLPRVDVGDKVPLQLKADAYGVYFTWSIAALVGALTVLWGSESRRSMQAHDEMSRFELPRNG